MEDIIEEIVGDIQDEFDDEDEDIIKIDENNYLCDTRADIEDINKHLDLNIPHDDYDTLGGFVFDLFGKISSDTVQHMKEWEFIINDMDGHKTTQDN